MSDLTILVCWYTHPAYIPPFRLSKSQVTVGPKVAANQTLAPYDAFTPFGRFDLHATLESLRLPLRYDAIVVWSDAYGSNQPLNLGAFDCPKILCVGDTHHMQSPIERMIGYAREAKYDFVLSSHNRQHLHWFAEASFDRVAWLPGLKVQVFNHPFSAHRRQEVCFFGAAEKFHPRRVRLLTELSRRKAFTFVARGGNQKAAADHYASSAVSLNCSLNGDLNLRVFEVLSAGGCLLTDRLSDQSGLHLLLEENKEFIGFDTLEECIEQARFLLGHPNSALEIARAGAAVFQTRLHPRLRIEDLFRWTFDGELDSLFRVPPLTAPSSFTDAANAPGLMERINVYERLQELHRILPSPTVLFLGSQVQPFMNDAVDLRHLKIFASEHERSALPAALADRCTVIPRPVAASSHWDCVVAHSREFIGDFAAVREWIHTSAPRPRS